MKYKKQNFIILRITWKKSKTNGRKQINNNFNEPPLFYVKLLLSVCIIRYRRLVRGRRCYTIVVAVFNMTTKLKPQII